MTPVIQPTPARPDRHTLTADERAKLHKLGTRHARLCDELARLQVALVKEAPDGGD